MEPQLFYWTGKIIWYALCIAACATAVVAATIAPFMAFRDIRKHLWHWKLSAEIAKFGFTEADIRFAISLQEDLPCKYTDLIKAVQRIKERGDSITKQKAKSLP